MQLTKSDPEQLPATLSVAEFSPAKKPLTKLVMKAADKPISVNHLFQALTEELIMESTRQGERKRQKKALNVLHAEIEKHVNPCTWLLKPILRGLLRGLLPETLLPGT